MARIGKQDLSDIIMQKTGLVRKDAEAALNAVLDGISDALQNGDKVTIPNFGSFEVKEVSARPGRNIQTSEPITIPAHNKVKFTAGKALADSVR